jgi:precorrin-6B methylase 2
MIIEVIGAFIFIVVFILSVTLLYAFISLAPWVPTPKKELERINRLADLKSGQVFYEIGCGTARVSSFIARKNPEVKVVGIELALPIYLFARSVNFFGSPKNLQIEFGDAFSKNYSDADAVYIYGLPATVNGRLKNKLEKELRPGAKFISYAFAVDGWKGSGNFKDKPNAGDVSVNVYVR